MATTIKCTVTVIRSVIPFGRVEASGGRENAAAESRKADSTSPALGSKCTNSHLLSVPGKVSGGESLGCVVKQHVQPFAKIATMAIALAYAWVLPLCRTREGLGIARKSFSRGLRYLG